MSKVYKRSQCYYAVLSKSQRPQTKLKNVSQAKMKQNLKSQALEKIYIASSYIATEKSCWRKVLCDFSFILRSMRAI